MKLTDAAQLIAAHLADDLITTDTAIELLADQANGELTLLAAAHLLVDYAPRPHLDDGWTPYRDWDGRWRP